MKAKRLLGKRKLSLTTLLLIAASLIGCGSPGGSFGFPDAGTSPNSVDNSGGSSNGADTCKEKKDCPRGHTCDTAIGECTAASCNIDDECGKGLVCDQSTKLCKGADCTDDTSCGNGMHCDNGQCEVDTCTTRDDCDSGYDCNAGKCVENPAESDACKDIKCDADQGLVCSDGFCVPNCDDACGGVCCNTDEGEVCLNGKFCAAQCSQQEETLCEVNGARECCTGDQTCLANTCAPNGPICDYEKELYCTMTQICYKDPLKPDTSDAHCIERSNVPEICIYVPENEFDIEEIYHWKGDNQKAPGCASVMMTPIVIDVDQDGSTAEIIIHAYDDYGHCGAQPLIVLNGKPNSSDITDVSSRWVSTALPGDDRFDVKGQYTPAAGNIDDPDLTDAEARKIEIVTVQNNGYVRAVDARTGKKKWVSDEAVEGTRWDSVTLANLDYDGPAEVIVGHLVLDGATGKTLCNLGAPNKTWVAADLDQSGNMEIIGGRQTIRFERESDGTAKCTKIPQEENSTSVLDVTHNHLAAVANIIDNTNDPNDKPEIAVVGSGKLVLTDYRGKEIARVPLYKTDVGGPPTIADFNGDGRLDIAAAGKEGYEVFEVKESKTTPPTYTLVRLWMTNTDDQSSESTGSSVFDFNGDGRAEVVYNDQNYLFVYDGQGGVAGKDKQHNPIITTKEILRIENKTYTWLENPIVVDLDQDGTSEIISISNNSEYKYRNQSEHTGVRVWRDKKNKWVGTRPVWNQHTYHITNITNDGQIPKREVPHWTQPFSNNFRQNPQVGEPRYAPNLTVTLNNVLSGSCSDKNSSKRKLVFTVYNTGSKKVEANTVSVTLSVKGSKKDDWKEITKIKVNEEIGVGKSVKLEYDWDMSDKFSHLSASEIDIKAVVDEEDLVGECKEKDNEAIITNITTAAPDLVPEIEKVDIAACSSNGGTTMPVEVKITNKGGAKFIQGAVKVKLYYGLPGALDHFEEALIDTDLKTDESTVLTFNLKIKENLFVNRGIAIKAVVDEENLQIECDESNNEAELTDKTATCFVLG